MNFFMSKPVAFTVAAAAGYAGGWLTQSLSLTWLAAFAGIAVFAFFIGATAGAVLGSHGDPYR